MNGAPEEIFRLAQVVDGDGINVRFHVLLCGAFPSYRRLFDDSEEAQLPVPPAPFVRPVRRGVATWRRRRVSSFRRKRVDLGNGGGGMGIGKPSFLANMLLPI